MTAEHVVDMTKLKLLLMLLLGNASLVHSVEAVLHQQLCVLVDCISQPYETVSRLGCSCIRYSVTICY